jgi:hypothetical protein
MSKLTKVLERVLRGTSDANIGFEDLCMLLRHPEAAGEPPEQQQERSQDSQERQDG